MEKETKGDYQSISKEVNARDQAMEIINKYNNDELSMGEYAHELITETYINLISQAQSGRVLCIDGQMLDIKIGSPRSENPNFSSFINGYRLGKYAVNYQQSIGAFSSDYEENANLTITVDGF